MSASLSRRCSRPLRPAVAASLDRQTVPRPPPAPQQHHNHQHQQPQQRRRPPPQQQQHQQQRRKRELQAFAEAWIPRLLQQQEDALEVSGKVSALGERVVKEVARAQTRLGAVMESVLGGQQGLARRGRGGAGALDLLGPPSGGPPTDEQLLRVVSDIQATNQLLRQVEATYADADSSLVGLQEGADARDAATEAYRDALLQLADDLELQEAEEAARAAAEARRREELRREEALRRELEELAMAASSAQAAQASLAVAETSTAALAGAPPVKVDIGVHRKTKPGQSVVLVGSHPCMGEWQLEGAMPMQWTDGHVWKASVELPADAASVEYKAVLRCSDGQCVWESGSNHAVDVAGASDVSLYHVFTA